MVIDWLFDWWIDKPCDQNSGRSLVDELDGSNLIIITALMNVWSSSFFVCGRFCHWRISSIVTCQIFQFEVINHHFIPFWQSKWPLSLFLFLYSHSITLWANLVLKVASKISFHFVRVLIFVDFVTSNQRRTRNKICHFLNIYCPCW